jgi:hypothetical protein
MVPTSEVKRLGASRAMSMWQALALKVAEMLVNQKVLTSNSLPLTNAPQERHQVLPERDF